MPTSDWNSTTDSISRIPITSATSSVAIRDIRIHGCPDCMGIWSQALQALRSLCKARFEGSLTFQASPIAAKPRITQ